MALSAAENCGLFQLSVRRGQYEGPRVWQLFIARWKDDRRFADAVELRLAKFWVLIAGVYPITLDDWRCRLS